MREKNRLILKYTYTKDQLAQVLFKVNADAHTHLREDNSLAGDGHFGEFLQQRVQLCGAAPAASQHSLAIILIEKVRA